MPETEIEEMMFTKNMFGKNGGRQYIHIVQSFDPKDELSYETANEIGIKLAEYFVGFQAVVATHKDRDHIHNHILLNSVNFETGLKFQQSKDGMQAVKDFSDKLCLEYGLSVIEKSKEVMEYEFSKVEEYRIGETGYPAAVATEHLTTERAKISTAEYHAIAFYAPTTESSNKVSNPNGNLSGDTVSASRSHRTSGKVAVRAGSNNRSSSQTSEASGKDIEKPKNQRLEDMLADKISIIKQRDDERAATRASGVNRGKRIDRGESR